ncbi:hypothetical protein TNCV_998011 [Trichonephila clavipes]|nr:hypothetical protein TNCV_998011 [Trichonephila clavipes]
MSSTKLIEVQTIPRAGSSQVQIVCVEEETEHGLFSLKKPTNTQRCLDQVTGDTMLDGPLCRHAPVTMFEHSGRCEPERCRLGTQGVLPGKKVRSIDRRCSKRLQ